MYDSDKTCEDRSVENYPTPMGMPGCEASPSPHRDRGTSPQRKQELMQLAIGIAAQVQASTKRGSERCLLRQMVEMFLDL